MVGRTWAAALTMVIAAALGLVAVAPGPTEAVGTVGARSAKPAKPPKPVVSKVDPRSGSTAGGTVVTVKGKHLQTAKSVLFGKAKGTKLKVKSDKKLTVVAPAHAAGVVDVTVKTKGGRSARSSTAKFTYAVVKPQVTAVSPSTAPDTGGTRVTVTGSGFSGVTAVTFGGTAGTAVSVSSPTQLSVTSPEHAPGLVHVNVTNAAGTSPNKNGDLFRFTATPRTSTAPVPAGADPDPRTNLLAVSCPSGGSCMAVGSYFKAGPPVTRRPLVERRTGTTTWQAIDVALPGDAAANQVAQLVDVSCPTATFCAAVGEYQRTDTKFYPLVTTWDGTSWSAGQGIDLPLTSNGATQNAISAIDCPTATSCFGVGSDYTGVVHQFLVLTYAAPSWTLSVETPPLGVDPAIVDVSCPTATYCMAVGSGDDGAGGQVPLVATLSGGLWTSAVGGQPADAKPIAPDALYERVSCTAASTCTAVGHYLTTDPKYLGLVRQQTSSGTTNLAVGAPANAGSDPQLRLHDVSCSVGVQCTAVGDYVGSGGQRGLLVSTGSAGVAPSEAPLPATAVLPAEVDAVTCLGESACAAVGSHQTVAAAQFPLLESLSNAGWAGQTAPVPAGWVGGGLLAVAADGTTGVGVGRYQETGGHFQALITIDIPLA